MEQSIINNYNCPVKPEYCQIHKLNYNGLLSECPLCKRERESKAKTESIKTVCTPAQDEARQKVRLTARLLKITGFNLIQKEEYLLMDLVDMFEWTEEYTRENKRLTVIDLMDFYGIKTCTTTKRTHNKAVIDKEEVEKLVFKIRLDKKIKQTIGINKVCITCGKEKDLSLFYKQSKAKDGYKNSCIDCDRIHYKTAYKLKQIQKAKNSEN